MVERNPLSLVVKEKTLGCLITNAKDVKAFVTEKLKEYSLENYTGDVKKAAKDKAELNKAANTLNTTRIALEKEWNKPFQEFKEVVNETVKLIKDVSNEIDSIVKAEEQKEKDAKKQEIQNFWNTKNFELVTLDRVFDNRWLNKTVKVATAEAEIESIIKRITKDLEVLDSFDSDTANLKDLYLSTLDLQKTLDKGAELKANRERLEKAELEKKEAEKIESKTEDSTISKMETLSVEDEVTQENNIEGNPELCEKTYMFNLFGNSLEIESVIKVIKMLALKSIPSITVQATASEIEQFKQLLTREGIGYDKQPITNLAIKRI